MGLTISGGSFVTNINSFFIGGLPQTSSQASLVTSNLTHHFDAGNATSYPGSGDTWFNIAPGGTVNAKIVSSPTYVSSNGGYFVFNGTSQYASSSFSYTNKTFTFNFVLNFAPLSSGFTGFRFLSTLAGTHTIEVAREFDTNVLTKLTVSQGTTNFFNTVVDTPSGFMSSSQNTMMTLTSDATTLYLYRNAVLVATSSDPFANSSITNGVIYFSANPPGPSYVSMSFFNILIYTSSLSSAEVTQNYNALKSRYSLP